MLVRVKQVMGFYKVFIIKNKEGWGSNHKKEKKRSNNKSRQARFTASPGRSDIGHAVFQWVLNYEWVKEQMT